jgi:hypothetical protein
MNKRSALDSPADSPARDAGRSRGAGFPRDDRRDDGRWADRGVAPRTDTRTGWVVVADEAIARILVADPETPSTLRAEQALTDVAAHARKGQLAIRTTPVGAAASSRARAASLRAATPAAARAS